MFAAFDPRASEGETQVRCTPLALVAVGSSVVEENNNEPTTQGDFENETDADITETLTETNELNVFGSDDPILSNENMAIGVGVAALAGVACYWLTRSTSAPKDGACGDKSAPVDTESVASYLMAAGAVILALFGISAIRSKYAPGSAFMHKIGYCTTSQWLVKNFLPVLREEGTWFTKSDAAEEVFAKIATKDSETGKTPKYNKGDYIINRCGAHECVEGCDVAKSMTAEVFEALYTQGEWKAGTTVTHNVTKKIDSLSDGYKVFRPRKYVGMELSQEDIEEITTKGIFQNDKATTLKLFGGEEQEIVAGDWLMCNGYPTHTWESKLMSNIMANPSTAQHFFFVQSDPSDDFEEIDTPKEFAPSTEEE